MINESLKHADDLLAYASVIIQIEEVRKAGDRTREFNIFEILDRARDEVKGHSQFLWVLLNPNGVHGLGDVFLKAFFDELLSAYGWKLDPSENVIVEREKYAPSGGVSGNIDLYIETNTEIIVIENKIDAADQNEQLKRYVDYVDGNNPKGKKVFVIYLTLNGDEPSENSRGNIDSANLFCLSYKSFFPGFLESCIKESAYYSVVRESINQYKQLLEKITRENYSMTEVEEISTKIDTAEKLKAAWLISQSLEWKRIELEKLFWHELKESLKNSSSLKGLDFNIDYVGQVNDEKIAKGTGHYGIWISLYEKDGLIYCFNINRESGWLYQGVRILNSGTLEIVDAKNREEYFSNLFEKLQPVYKDAKRSRTWVIWNTQTIGGKINMKDVNVEFINLLDANNRDSYIAEYANQIVELIDNTKKVLG